MSDPSSRSIAFLLSLGGIPLACIGGVSSSATDPTGATEATSVTTGTGSTAEGTGTEPTATDPSGTGTDGMTTSETATTSTGETTGVTGETTGETTTGPDGVCEAYAAWASGCGEGDYAELLSECQMGLMAADGYGGAPCVAAVEDYYACLPKVACDDPDASLCSLEGDRLINFCLTEIGTACLEYDAKYDACIEPYGGYAGFSCQVLTNEGFEESEACGEAYEDFFACLTALDCVDFEPDSACPEESAAIDSNCEN